MPSIDADVVLVAEPDQREARPLRLAWPWCIFDRTARVAVPLTQLGGVVPLRRDAAFLDVALLAIAIALFRRGDNRGIDDLAAHRQEPGQTTCEGSIRRGAFGSDRANPCQNFSRWIHGETVPQIHWVIRIDNVNFEPEGDEGYNNRAQQ